MFELLYPLLTLDSRASAAMTATRPNSTTDFDNTNPNNLNSTQNEAKHENSDPSFSHSPTPLNEDEDHHKNQQRGSGRSLEEGSGNRNRPSQGGLGLDVSNDSTGSNDDQHDLDESAESAEGSLPVGFKDFKNFDKFPVMLRCLLNSPGYTTQMLSLGIYIYLIYVVIREMER